LDRGIAFKSNTIGPVRYRGESVLEIPVSDRAAHSGRHDKRRYRFPHIV